MNWVGSGFITIIIYGQGEIASGQGVLLTEAGDDILTEAGDTILIEQI